MARLTLSFWAFVWLAVSLSGQTLFQSTNPNYPERNPFFFEGRIDWELLKIDVPSNAWEFTQRGIHRQDDLEDVPGAIADYRQAVAMNNVGNGTCQILTAVPANFGHTTNPPPCMFTARLRLANLLLESDAKAAITLFQEVLKIDALRLDVNAKIGEAYTILADKAQDDAIRSDALSNAITAYQAELALSPVTDSSKALTGDEANNAHVHWALAEIYQKLGRNSDAAGELDLYLKATKWHSDTYAWRIQLAQKRLQQLQQSKNPAAKR